VDEEHHVERLEPDRLHRKEVARHDPLGLNSKKLRPRRSGASRRRTEAMLSQQRPDRGGTDPDAELAQLPTDPHAAPPGILPGHLQDERCGLRVDRRPAGSAFLAVGPLALDQCAVPAQQRLGRDEQRCPPLSGEHPAGGSEQDPVGCGELGATGLAAQHPKLMPQDEDLQVLGAVVSVWEDQQAREWADGHQSMKSIAGWYGTPAHDANPSFRAPHYR
jgi:hypothetical protein